MHETQTKAEMISPLNYYLIYREINGKYFDKPFII